MAEKKFHKGWLYERDGVKFAPYTLKENIIDRNGNLWSPGVDSTISQLSSEVNKLTGTTIPELEESISTVSDRASTLETRTRYIDTSDNSNALYITDINGKIITLIDNNGIKSYDFLLPDNTSVKTSLSQINGNLSQLTGVTIPALRDNISDVANRTVTLETRTQYINTSDSNKIFYVAGEDGTIILQADNDGVKGYDFILPGSTSVKTSLLQINSNISSLSNRASTLETRTQYIDTSDTSKALYVADESGNIIAQIDDNYGVMSYKFTISTTENTKIPCVGYELTGNKIIIA